MINLRRQFGCSVRRRAGFHHTSNYYKSRHQGFTLTELMVASLLTTVVILLAWTGLLSAINMSNQAQAVTARKIELTTALDMMTQEVRQAQAVNQSGTVIANSSGISVADVVASAGLNSSELGNVGDIALYLEIPTNSNITSCLTEDGPKPADQVDRIVYDVRESPIAWLPPKAIGRYGRIPSIDGSIDPCSKPVANDVIADAIADTSTEPDCDGVLSGSHGFHICQQGARVDLLFKSAIREVDTIPMNSSVTTRAVDFRAASDSSPQSDPDDTTLVLDITSSAVSDQVDLRWTWEGSVVGEINRYILTIRVDQTREMPPSDADVFIPSEATSSFLIGGSQTQYSGYDLKSVATQGDRVCFKLEAFPDQSAKVTSNRVCQIVP